MVSVAACGSSDDSRDAALQGLDRAVAAAQLQSEMAGLLDEQDVEDQETAESSVGTDDAEGETETVVETETETVVEVETVVETVTETAVRDEGDPGTALNEINARATELIADADTGTNYDEAITSSVEATRSASEDVARALGDPAALAVARTAAIGKLEDSGQNLTKATAFVEADLEDDQGEISPEDQERLDAANTEVDAANEAVANAACTYSRPEMSAEPFQIVVESGDVGCAEAVDVLNQYFDESTPKEGTAGLGVVGGWTCSVAHGATALTAENVARCERISEEPLPPDATGLGGPTLARFVLRRGGSTEPSGAGSEAASASGDGGRQTGENDCGSGVSASPDTTCPFARDVAQEYQSSGDTTVTVFSEAKGRDYEMTCQPGTTTVCRGGRNAVVYIN